MRDDSTCISRQLWPCLDNGRIAGKAALALISGHECEIAAIAKFKVILEKVETTINQGTVMGEVLTAEEARQIILADLNVEPGSHDDRFEPVESGTGEITVAVENRRDPAQIPRSLAS